MKDYFAVKGGITMQNWRKKLEDWMNNYKLKKKLMILYIFCVIFPLIVTDGVVFYIVIHSEQVKQKHAMENDASAVQYSLSNSVEYASSMAKNIYTNEYIEDILNKSYATPLDYVTAYQTFKKNSLFDSSMGGDNTLVTIYAENETIISGGVFGRIESIKETDWYQFLQGSGLETVLYFYYDDQKSPAVKAMRRIVFLRKMNFFGSRSCEKVVKIELDYSNLVRSLQKMNYTYPVYICQNGKILLSNDGHTHVGQDFEEFTEYKKVGYKMKISLYGAELEILILKTNIGAATQIWKNFPLILLLVFTNAGMPWCLMCLINRSFTLRIEELSRAFKKMDQERLEEIADIRGEDEIGQLMLSYNHMASRINELIQTVYKDRLREQEMDIARQNAELLALHSQINPHFLFNALESIRMHSILKKEYETADMVEKLAIMERQNVDWGTDFVEVRREMEFVEAYLGLQKYRFGDRLSYELEIEPECREIHIPKLTVVTFVENACIHGIESKAAPGWIFVRIYQMNKEMYIEVEDTGDGLEESVLAQIKEKMREVNIEKMKKEGRVGILNACLRLKLMTENQTQFEIESEKGVGTIVQIRIPLNTTTTAAIGS